jgi:cephalosporin hydroxylase
VAWSDIPGWSGFLWAYDEAVASAPDNAVFVELGVAFGRSIAYLSRKVIDSGKHVRIWAIDPWWDDWWHVPDQYHTTLQSPTWGGEHSQFGRDLGGPFSAFVHCMRTHASEELERINVLRCRSAEAALMIGSCDMVCIDADHNYGAVAQDIALWKPRIRSGGWLIGDDWSVNFPGVQRAVREAFGDSFEVRETTWRVRL